MKKLIATILLICTAMTPQSLLDNTFGNGGIVKTNISTNFGMSLTDGIFDTYLYPDGKILAAGQTDRNFALARYNVDGTLDVTFNPTGVGFVPPGTVKTALDATKYDEIYSIAVHPDGKIITCGYVEKSDDSNWKWIALVRYASDGSIDATFGTDGIVKIKVPVTGSFGHNSFGKKVFIISDKYLVVGYVENTLTGTKSDLFMARFNSDGTIDNTFGTNGFVTTDLESNGIDKVSNAIQQADGKIVVVGSWQASGSSSNPIFNAVVRFNSDGTLDTSFGTGGIVSHQFVGSFTIKHEEARAVVIQSDGKVVVAGVVTKETNEMDFFVIRYSSIGIIDNTFSSKGFIFVDFNGNTDQVYSMSMQTDGKFVVVGSSTDSNYLTDFSLARINSNGTLDKKLNLDLSSISDAAYSVFVQPDGKIVASGSTINGTFTDFALVRFNPELPTSVNDNSQNFPENLVLSQNYPNPFNPSTKISWQSPVSSHQTLKVYDMLGNEVATLVDEFREAESYEIEFSASHLPSGLYFYKLRAGNFSETKKMILTK